VAVSVNVCLTEQIVKDVQYYEFNKPLCYTYHVKRAKLNIIQNNRPSIRQILTFIYQNHMFIRQNKRLHVASREIDSVPAESPRVICLKFHIPL